MKTQIPITTPAAGARFGFERGYARATNFAVSFANKLTDPEEKRIASVIAKVLSDSLKADRGEFMLSLEINSDGHITGEKKP